MPKRVSTPAPATRRRKPAAPSARDEASAEGRSSLGGTKSAEGRSSLGGTKGAEGRGSLAGWLLGAGLVGGLGVASFGWSSGCKHEPPPGATIAAPEIPPVEPVRITGGAPFDAAAVALATADASTRSTDPGKPYDGPLIGSIVGQAPIYAGMEALKDKRIGYIRHGGKAPVDPTPIKAGNCEAGWFHLLGGGYVCGKFVTLDLNNPQVRLGTTPPNLDDILPYKYAWNTTMGTPLYKSVPSREDMLQYEPYLKTEARRKTQDEGTATAAIKEAPNSDNPYGPAPGSATDGGVTPAAEKKAWWQTDFDGGKPDIKLSDLTDGADALVAKRMVKGFYVAIDRQFGWNSRTWYKTTASLVAPADRFAVNKPPTFVGTRLEGSEPKQPVGFVLSTHAQKYKVDPEKKQVAPTGPVPRFSIARLTGRVAQIVGIVYRETAEGWWMKGIDGTYTDPGAPPEGLLPGEKWIDVNLSRQTLVALEGDKPVYATIVSTGRKAKDPADKVHDHKTVMGTFRIREKHISTTMDGDGPAPGDMPYSIEDVPYVMYFEGSYALHGAFWHSNFGREQSHGCVNLAPLDAKQIFFWTEPELPQGWHGVLSTKEKLGTRVVVHE